MQTASIWHPLRYVARLGARVLIRAAQSALGKGEYARAEWLFGLALRIAERWLGRTDVVVGAVLHDLGIVHRYQGRFDDAGRVDRRAHAIFLAARGEVSLELAALSRDRGDREHVLAPDHPAVAATLAAFLDGQGKREEAEPLFRRALAVFERTCGAEHHEVAETLTSLGALCHAKGEAAEAERLFQRALAIEERRLGGDHPDVATTLNNLAALCRVQGRDAEAESLCRRALAIFERTLGASHPRTVACRENRDALASGVQ